MAKKLLNQMLTARWSPRSKPLGILGGGQLAQMLALKAHELGIPVAVLSESKDDPAAQVVGNWRKGRLNSAKDLKSFLSTCSSATFESEFLDAELLATLAKKTRTPIWPKPLHMQIVQDRLSQKRLLEENRVPTAPYLQVDTFEDAQRALEMLHGKAVFKKRRFGYDGYGTFVVGNANELKKFKSELARNQSGFIAEAFIPFRRELAIIVVRGKKGELVRLPLVESFQENSKCLWVKGPVRENAKMTKLLKVMERLMNRLQYVGAMGVEIFDTGSGYLVNELAPRVHNSGHYSMNALSEDQFALHLKAVTGLPFKTTNALAKGFAMVNLLGQDGRSPSGVLTENCYLHWYGKTENRKGRKMGHLNALGPSPDTALKKALKGRKGFNL